MEANQEGAKPAGVNGKQRLDRKDLHAAHLAGHAEHCRHYSRTRETIARAKSRAPDGRAMCGEGNEGPVGTTASGGGHLEGTSRLKQGSRPALDHAVPRGGRMLKVEVSLDLLDELRVEEVACAVRDHRPHDRLAE